MNVNVNTIREQLNKPWVVGVIGLVVGLIIGLFVLGWGLTPVQWFDAAPNNLRADLQEDWIRMSIDSYALYPDQAVRARQRYTELGSSGPDVLATIKANPGYQKPDSIAAYQALVTAGAAVGTPGAVTTPGATVPAATPTAQPSGGSFVRTVLPILCVLTVLLAAALVAVFLLRGRVRAPATTPATQAKQAAPQAEWAQYAAAGEEPPMAQFMASYKLGDDLFDDSFSIDSPSGEFLGECGVGISETIGVGDPKRVTAFEVWLFDKNDIQTVTKVLMSAHAYSDETIRQRLAAKGEPVQAAPGTQVVLETATLQLVSRVVDMSYGEGALPPESFFDNLVLELAVWPK